MGLEASTAPHLSLSGEGTSHRPVARITWVPFYRFQCCWAIHKIAGIPCPCRRQVLFSAWPFQSLDTLCCKGWPLTACTIWRGWAGRTRGPSPVLRGLCWKRPCAPRNIQGPEALGGELTGPGPSRRRAEPWGAPPTWAPLGPMAWFPLWPAQLSFWRPVVDSGWSFTDLEGEIRPSLMPLYVPFMGHKEMAPLGAWLPCQPPPLCLSLPLFYCPLLSSSLPTPHPGADPETITPSKLLLAFPDLLPQARKVTLLAGLGRAWLGPQPGMAGAGGGGGILPAQWRPRAAQLVRKRR